MLLPLGSSLPLFLDPPGGLPVDSWYLVSLPLVVTATLLITLALFTWQRRWVRGARPAMKFLLAVSIWILGYAVELALPSMGAKLLAAKLEYIGIVATPVTFLSFALDYTGHSWQLNRRRSLLLSVIPAITLLLVWTNELHGLVWRSMRLVELTSFTALDVSYGPWFWIHTLYSYALLLAGLILILLLFLRSPRFYRRQALVLLVALIVPWTANILYTTSSLGASLHLDLTPYAMAVAGIALTWGLLRYHLFDVAPAAQAVILSNMQDGVLVLDEGGRILSLNPAARRMADVPEERMTGRPLAQVFSGWPDFLAAVTEQAPARQEVIREQDGRRVLLDVTVSPLRDGQGRDMGRLVLMRDLTEQKQMEAALRENEAQLRQMVEQLQELDRLKSKFISDVSHELRTPLTNIKLYLSLLASGNQERRQDYMRILESEILNLQQIVETVLDFSRVDMARDRKAFRPVLVNLTQLVERVVFGCRTQAELNGVTLEFQRPERAVFIQGEHEELVKAVTNLVVNAIKYTLEGGRVRVVLDVVGQEVVIRVEDTGIGIPPEEQERLFERFFRGEQASALGISGTGLGLSIVQEVVELHGGQIQVESQPGHGSTFTMHLPRLENAGPLMDPS